MIPEGHFITPELFASQAIVLGAPFIISAGNQFAVNSTGRVSVTVVYHVL